MKNENGHYQMYKSLFRKFLQKDLFMLLLSLFALTSAILYFLFLLKIQDERDLLVIEGVFGVLFFPLAILFLIFLIRRIEMFFHFSNIVNYRIAKSNNHIEVCKIALNEFKECKSLSNMGFNYLNLYKDAKQFEIREKLFDYINSKDLQINELKEVAKKTKYKDIGEIIIDFLKHKSTEDSIFSIAEKAKNIEIQKYALENIDNEDNIISLAKSTSHMSISALNKINDAKKLFEIAKEAASIQVIENVINKLEDKKLVKKLYDKYSNENESYSNQLAICASKRYNLLLKADSLNEFEGKIDKINFSPLKKEANKLLQNLRGLIFSTLKMSLILAFVGTLANLFSNTIDEPTPKSGIF